MKNDGAPSYELKDTVIRHALRPDTIVEPEGCTQLRLYAARG